MLRRHRRSIQGRARLWSPGRMKGMRKRMTRARAMVGKLLSAEQMGMMMETGTPMEIRPEMKPRMWRRRCRRGMGAAAQRRVSPGARVCCRRSRASRLRWSSMSGCSMAAVYGLSIAVFCPPSRRVAPGGAGRSGAGVRFVWRRGLICRILPLDARALARTIGAREGPRWRPCF